MGNGRHRKWGWADDVVAPPQEFDTLAALDEAAWVEEALRSAEARKGEQLTPDEILEEHKKARVRFLATRRESAPDQEEMEALLERFALFGAQASARARRSSTSQLVVSFSCPDQPGIVAAATREMAEAGGNIEAAFMSVVAGQLVTSFLVSGEAADHPEGLGLRIRSSVGEFGDVSPAVVSIQAGDIKWPRPGSTYWHLSARWRGGEALLPAVTHEIAKKGLPLLALSSWLEQPLGASDAPVEVVDLNFAIAGGRERDSEMLRSVVNALSDRLPGAQLSPAPVEGPTRRQFQENVVDVMPGDPVLTILGQAQPGFVHAAVNATSESFGAAAQLTGSSMAILEGITVLTLVLSRSAEPAPDPAEIEERIVNQLTAAGYRDPVARVAELHGPADSEAVGSESSIAVPTHELRLLVPEQPSVIAEVAQVLATKGVNITWFVSYVLEPVVGQTWPICALEMHIHVPEGKESDMGTELRSLAERKGWRSLRVQPWSLTAGYDGRDGAH